MRLMLSVYMKKTHVYGCHPLMRQIAVTHTFSIVEKWYKLS
jgi:hypothetical protein